MELKNSTKITGISFIGLLIIYCFSKNENVFELLEILGLCILGDLIFNDVKRKYIPILKIIFLLCLLAFAIYLLIERQKLGYILN